MKNLSWLEICYRFGDTRIVALHTSALRTYVHEHVFAAERTDLASFLICHVKQFSVYYAPSPMLSAIPTKVVTDNT